MSEFLGHAYNYDVFEPQRSDSVYFRSSMHAGDDAPDFTLPGLSGGDVMLSSLRGKPVVVEFGSVTCPPCQRGFPLMDQLARDFAGQAEFVFVYVREAHPDDFPDYAAHRSFEQKWKHAGDLRERHKTPRTILVDDLDGAVHRLYGGRLNTCWIINDAGRVSYKAEWTSEPHVRKAIEETLRVSDLTRQGGFKDFYQESMTAIEGGRPPRNENLPGR